MHVWWNYVKVTVVITDLPLNYVVFGEPEFIILLPLKSWHLQRPPVACLRSDVWEDGRGAQLRLTQASPGWWREAVSGAAFLDHEQVHSGKGSGCSMDRWQFFLYQLVLLGGLISTLAQVGLANSLIFFLELLLFFFITSTYTYNRLFF